MIFPLAVSSQQPEQHIFPDTELSGYSNVSQMLLHKTRATSSLTLYEVEKGLLLICQNTTMRLYGNGLTDIECYVKKTPGDIGQSVIISH